MTYEYNIPMIPKSLNHYAGRKNDREYQADKREWTNIVLLCCRKRPPEPIKRAKVTITYHFGNRIRHDPDNYSGKMILDGIVRAGIIKDDSFSCIDLCIRGLYDKQQPRTTVSVEEIEDDSERIQSQLSQVGYVGR